MGEGIGQARPGVKRGICKGLTHLVTQITALGGERRASLRRQECSGGLETKRKGKGRKKKAFLSSRASMVAQMLRNLPAVWETGLIPGSRRYPWRREWQLTPVFPPGETPWTEEPGGPQSMGSQRVGHDWATNTKNDAYERSQQHYSESQREETTQMPITQLMNRSRKHSPTRWNTARFNTHGNADTRTLWRNSLAFSQNVF